MLALFRLAERAAYLLPVFATAGASLLIGLIWLRIDQGELGRVAQALPAAKEEQVVPRESTDEKVAADAALLFEKKLKPSWDASLAEEARPSSDSAMEVRAPAPAFGKDIAHGEPPQISPAPAPMAVAPASKPESLVRGRAEPLLAQDVADSLRTEDVRDDEGQMAGRAKLMRRSGERFMAGPARKPNYRLASSRSPWRRSRAPPNQTSRWPAWAVRRG